MTDDATGSDPTDPPGRSWRIPALVGALVIVIVVAVAVAVGRGDDDSGTDVSADPTSASTSTPATPTGTAGPSTSESPSASASPTVGDPVASPVINQAAKDAIRDDFPALIPAGVPAGWTVVSAAYNRKAETWWIELTDPNGAAVRLAQSTDPVEELVTLWLGPDAQPSGKVDLSDYGTGMWRGYTSTAGPGIAKQLSGTSAVVFGADQDSLVELAQELLTAEDAGDSDGG
jgi:uncharacterized protein DUF4245